MNKYFSQNPLTFFAFVLYYNQEVSSANLTQGAHDGSALHENFLKKVKKSA